MVLEPLRSLPVTIRTNLNMWLTFPFLWEKTFKGGTLTAVKTLALNLFIRRTNRVETVASPSLPRGFSTAGRTPDLGRPSLSRWEGCSLQTRSDSVSPQKQRSRAANNICLDGLSVYGKSDWTYLTCGFHPPCYSNTQLWWAEKSGLIMCNLSVFIL